MLEGHGGQVVGCRPPNREVLGLKPTSARLCLVFDHVFPIVLILPRKSWLYFCITMNLLMLTLIMETSPYESYPRFAPYI